MLTGGRSAKQLYSSWREIPCFGKMSNVNYFFGDERCVPADHIDSNYAMTMKTLFPNGVPSGCALNKIEADNLDKEAAAIAYEEIIPDVIDILLLGLGADGHIASIFPNSPTFKSRHRKLMFVHGPNEPIARITITPNVIIKARTVYLLALGKEKGRILREALRTPNEIEKLPVCMTLNGTWLLDKDAAHSALMK